ncbi:MAG TPA: Xaa-Pro aminopeptidase [Patescibacteria group bacterium]|nr:Xaa-Pro aminopeptidase [Patescibacteria group bacterium]
MGHAFGSDFFSGNRERLRQLFTGTAPIVLTANGLMQKNGDEAFPFQQDSSFWYLTGIDDPEVILVMDKGREYLIVPTREAIIETFDGAIDAAELTRRSGITEILNEKDGWKQLESRLGKVQHVATFAAAPLHNDFFGMYTNPARHSLIRRIKKVTPDVELLDLRQHLARMRMVKQPIELEAIQQAVDITVDTLKEAMRPARMAKYAYEYEIEAELTRGFRRRGAEGHGFTPVVAGGKNACTIHHILNDSPLTSDELVLLDVGASYNHYTADVARTYSLNGRPSRRQEQVCEAVMESQDYARSLLKPGVILNEYEKQMETFIGEKLRELGLIKSISRETVRDSGFFPHRTSHFLGLECHDAGNYDEPLRPGVALVAEPGIYIREEGIGVRIEDVMVITEDGCEILSGKLPRGLC